jgi:hypothetical protein
MSWFQTYLWHFNNKTYTYNFNTQYGTPYSESQDTEGPEMRKALTFFPGYIKYKRFYKQTNKQTNFAGRVLKDQILFCQQK